jgi:hypothetical protein
MVKSVKTKTTPARKETNLWIIGTAAPGYSDAKKCGVYNEKKLINYIEYII